MFSQVPRVAAGSAQGGARSAAPAAPAMPAYPNNLLKMCILYPNGTAFYHCRRGPDKPQQLTEAYLCALMVTKTRRCNKRGGHAAARFAPRPFSVQRVSSTADHTEDS